MKAAEGLRAVLADISAVKVRDIKPDKPRAGTAVCFRASVEIYGRPHTLDCEVASDAQPARLRTLLDARRKRIARSDADATRIIIAPRLSTEAQALCSANRTAFLGLDGNARLSIGEIFILKRTIPISIQSNVAQVRPMHTEVFARPLMEACELAHAGA